MTCPLEWHRAEPQVRSRQTPLQYVPVTKPSSKHQHSRTDQSIGKSGNLFELKHLYYLMSKPEELCTFQVSFFQVSQDIS